MKSKLRNMRVLEVRGGRDDALIIESRGRGKFEELNKRHLKRRGLQGEAQITLLDGNAKGLYYHYVIENADGYWGAVELDAYLFSSLQEQGNLMSIHSHTLSCAAWVNDDSKRAYSEFKKTLAVFIKEWEKYLPENPVGAVFTRAFVKASEKIKFAWDKL